MPRRYTYAYPRPAVTVDNVVFGWQPPQLQVLLIQRDRPPFAGQWATPGGFIEMDEPLDHAARRELQEETGLRVARLEQFYTFGAVDRDPRGRTISVAYYALVRKVRCRLRAGDDARSAEWFDVQTLPALAFDHDQVLARAAARLRERARQHVLGQDALPRQFTLVELRQLYEAILDERLPRAGFERRMLRSGGLQEVAAGQFRFARRGNSGPIW